jgi:hypothetical protein
MPRILSALKQLVVPGGKIARKVKAGPFRGLRMNLDLRSETQVYLGLFEREVYPSLNRLSQGIQAFVDIGAAQGEYTLFALCKTTAARVLAFEPDPKMCVLMRENLALNRLDNEPRLRLSKDLVGAQRLTGWVTLNDFAAEIPEPCFVKMDVDGGEVDVLGGATQILARADTRWLIETHSAELEVSCLRILQSAGYETTVIPRAWWRWILPELRGKGHNRWLWAQRPPPR